MTKFFLILHVLAAVIAVGPVAVAGSMFPPAARKAAVIPGSADAVAAARLLHRICRVYAVVGLAVPVFGLATASSLHVLGSPWLITSIALTGIAAVVLALIVLPTQATILADLTGSASSAVQAGRLNRPPVHRLTALTGVFNLLWAAVTILMIVRPGSTTGV